MERYPRRAPGWHPGPSRLAGRARSEEQLVHRLAHGLEDGGLRVELVDRPAESAPAEEGTWSRWPPSPAGPLDRPGRPLATRRALLREHDAPCCARRPGDCAGVLEQLQVVHGDGGRRELALLLDLAKLTDAGPASVLGQEAEDPGGGSVGLDGPAEEGPCSRWPPLPRRPACSYRAQRRAACCSRVGRPLVFDWTRSRNAARAPSSPSRSTRFAQATCPPRDRAPGRAAVGSISVTSGDWRASAPTFQRRGAADKRPLLPLSTVLAGSCLRVSRGELEQRPDHRAPAVRQLELVWQRIVVGD